MIPYGKFDAEYKSACVLFKKILPLIVRLVDLCQLKLWGLTSDNDDQWNIINKEEIVLKMRMYANTTHIHSEQSVTVIFDRHSNGFLCGGVG